MICKHRTPTPTWTHDTVQSTGPGTPHAGVSVIELMVAMSISLILLLGIVKIFMGSKESYRVRENISMMQETARFGLESLTSAILMADHWGGVRASDISVTATGMTGVKGSTKCDSDWIKNIGQPVFGAEGAASIGAVSVFDDCIDSSEYIPNSDVLMLRYAAGQPVPNDDVLSDANGLYVRTSTGEKGTLLNGGVHPATATGLADQDGTNNYQYRVEAYFLRPCSEKESGCNDGIPNLVKLTYIGGKVQQSPLVEGVEQLQFQYGIDSNADGQVEQFASASSVSNWNQVIAVRIDMLVRTLSEDSDGGFHRKRFTKVVQIRNRTRF